MNKNCIWVMVDIEADGPIPGDYSMISLGAVVVEPPPQRTFFGSLKPISELWVPEALAVSGYSREETLEFPDPAKTMKKFKTWLSKITRSPKFISDNNGFDWQFINWYFHHFLKMNPFGHSSTNLGSLYKGLVGELTSSFKRLRKTKHNHNPVNDALGNVEAFLKMNEMYELELLNSFESTTKEELNIAKV